MGKLFFLWYYNIQEISVIIIPYIIYKIKVMFLQNWYPRETSLLFTGPQM